MTSINTTLTGGGKTIICDTEKVAVSLGMTTQKQLDEDIFPKSIDPDEISQYAYYVGKHTELVPLSVWEVGECEKATADAYEALRLRDNWEKMLIKCIKDIGNDFKGETLKGTANYMSIVLGDAKKNEQGDIVNDLIGGDIDAVNGLSPKMLELMGLAASMPCPALNKRTLGGVLDYLMEMRSSGERAVEYDKAYYVNYPSQGVTCVYDELGGAIVSIWRDYYNYIAIECR